MHWKQSQPYWCLPVIAQCDLFITRNGKHDLNRIKACNCKEYTPWCKMHICCSQKQRLCRQSRRHGVALVGLAHPNKVPSSPQTKIWNTYTSVEFFYQFFNVKHPLLKTLWRRFCMWNAALKTGNLTLATCGVLYLHNSVTFPKLVRFSGSNESL